jgi:hypothetical protein
MLFLLFAVIINTTISVIKPEETLPLLKREEHNSTMRSFIFFGVFHPFVFACINPDSDSCASPLTVSSSTAATFFATYTKTSNSATTGLPAYATFCSNKPSKISSACSCLTVGAGTAKTTAKTTSASVIIESRDALLHQC